MYGRDIKIVELTIKRQVSNVAQAFDIQFENVMECNTNKESVVSVVIL